MLRITRRAGERIMLGDDIVIEVSEVRGGTVRIGIDAPRSLPVYREEIWLEVKRENQTAAANAPGDAFADVARLLGDAGVERKPSPGEPS
jgi:carbon storage regulator